jgi:transketolase
MGGGLEYGINGISHYGLEDVGVLRVQPDITLICPADHEQTRTALLATWDLPDPVYYRLGKDDKTTVPGLDGRFELGRAQLICHGTDLLFITMGSVAGEVASAVGALAPRGISCTVMVIASINPPPLEDLVQVLSRFRAVLTVEAHYIVGGLGSLVSEVIAERDLRCRLIRCGVKTTPNGISGSQSYLYRSYGLSSEMLTATALQLVQQTH